MGITLGHIVSPIPANTVLDGIEENNLGQIPGEKSLTSFAMKTGFLDTDPIKELAKKTRELIQEFLKTWI